MTDWNRIARHITDVTGESFQPMQPQSQGGGCINTTVKLTDGRQQWFVKLNSSSKLDMFEAEFQGLDEMARSESIRVPQPVCTGQTGNESYIVMQYLELDQASPGSQALAGEQLAAMHRQTADKFGWHRDNTIGATHQPNQWHENWTDFWQQQRLEFQLQLAANNGYRSRLLHKGEELLEQFPKLIDHNPSPSLIHGDLWGGNIGFNSEEGPVIYDPACYYADREAEIAMTELFGGFGPDFYSAYNAAWPMDEGYQTRKTLYNLYHILNHLNLFGSGYLGQAERMMDKLLSELR